MALWDNITGKASEGAAKAMQKAKEISNLAKLNSMISDEEAKVNNIYNQIGKLYVAMHSHDCEEEFADMIASFCEAEEKIKSYRLQVQDIKGIVRCPQCSAEVPADAAFCSSCGLSMNKINTDDMVRCEGCGGMVKKGAHFCTSCGMPMVQKATPKTPNMSDTAGEATSKLCPNCGIELEPDCVFCVNCGTKL